jgi:hypothetical protein
VWASLGYASDMASPKQCSARKIVLDLKLSSALLKAPGRDTVNESLEHSESLVEHSRKELYDLEFKLLKKGLLSTAAIIPEFRVES